MQPVIEASNNRSTIYRYLLLATLTLGLAVTGWTISATSTSAALHAKGASAPGQVSVGNSGYAEAGGLSASVPLTGCWTQLTSPNFGAGSNYLQGIAVVSPNDLWAVGYYTDTNNSANSLTEHGVSDNWSLVPAAILGGHYNYLQGVTAIAANNVWAVGGVITPSLKSASQPPMERPAGPSGTDHPGPPPGARKVDVPQGSTILDLFEHWNGTSWIRVTGALTTGLNFISSISAVSANDIWAVGYNINYQTITEHYNGTAWSVIPSPNVGTIGSFLQTVSAVSSDNVWAAGSYDNTNFKFQTLIEHWNGTSWQVVSTPNSGSNSNYLTGIWAMPGEIWAVGSYAPGTTYQTLALRSTDGGATFAPVATVNVGANNNIFNAVSCSAVNECAAVGTDVVTPPSGTHGLVERWDGTAWTDISPQVHPSFRTVNSPAGGIGSDFFAVLLSGGRLRADGVVEGPLPLERDAPDAKKPDVAPAQTLIMSYDDPCGGATPTPGGPTATPTSPTLASPTPSATRAPTQTPGGPTATPQACSIEFTDVLPGSTFYSFIHCLACRNIVSGYPDGTFKPNNNVTRGQLSKIVSNAAGFSEAQPTQMFEDVAVGSTFQLFIGRLASRGYIGGYPCGGPGEPCGPGNLPYFRPGNNATRGQIAKIDSNAAAFNDNPTGQQFEDVAVGSTYYTYTYRLVSRSIMSGYPCGGVGEPCGPSNLPYFRPNNNATRGQTSKIVANTFFPGCSQVRR